MLTELATEIVIPAAAAVGMGFAAVQWLLVSRVRLSPERTAAGGAKNGRRDDYLPIDEEEEEGLNDHNLVLKCAEIQSAISEG